MAVTIEAIQAAQERISPYIVRTPCIHLKNLDPVLGCQVYVKAECMQITGSFKLRGALNKLLSLPSGQLANGVTAASSGNHGRAVAFGAKMLGTTAVIVIPRTAPEIKIRNIRSLGAEVVMCEAEERFRIAEQICRDRHAVMIPPYNDEEIMAGQGTVGIELTEQSPHFDMVITPVSGGGLLGGVAAAVKALSPETEVFGAEPEAVPRYSVSLAAGRPTAVKRQTSAADALVSDLPGSVCFPVVREHADGVAAVSDEYLLKGMRLLLMEGKILAEPSSCIGLGAVLQGKIPVSPGQKVCFILSGGNVGMSQLGMLNGI